MLMHLQFSLQLIIVSAMSRACAYARGREYKIAPASIISNKSSDCADNVKRDSALSLVASSR